LETVDNDARGKTYMEAPIDLSIAQRWFAVEFNNRAWDLVEKKDRTAAESERMIHAAHAALEHWLAAGSAINEVRAYCLLATAYAEAGFGEGAVRYAEKCIVSCAQAGSELTPFDRACALGCAAKAHRCGGDERRADELRRQALDAAALLDGDDRGVFEKLYGA
jgi:hypothetical protein